MTRTTLVARGPWFMVCDRKECDTRVGPFTRQPDLQRFIDGGWFVANLWGDRCPECVAAGHVEPGVAPYIGDVTIP